MTLSISQLIQNIRERDDCEIKQANGLPDISLEELPKDVLEFYTLTGGALLFSESPYSIEIVSPKNFVRANPIIRGDSGEDDISFHWYIVATSGEQYITIDLAPSRLGRCYDSFWDCHAIKGSCPIIAMSFSELLERLHDSKGENLYWLESQFTDLGDAYQMSG